MDIYCFKKHPTKYLVIRFRKYKPFLNCNKNLKYDQLHFLLILVFSFLWNRAKTNSFHNHYTTNGVKTSEIPLNLKTDCKRNRQFLTVISFQPKRRRLYPIRSADLSRCKLGRQKKQLNLHEAEAALTWIDAFKVPCRAEEKADVPAAGTTPADLQVTDHFLFRCDVERLMKVKSLVAQTKVEIIAFNEIEAVLEKYLQPRKTCYCRKKNKTRGYYPEEWRIIRFTGTIL